MLAGRRCIVCRNRQETEKDSGDSLGAAARASLALRTAGVAVPSDRKPSRRGLNPELNVVPSRRGGINCLFRSIG
jgi:hypothetical protein